MLAIIMFVMCRTPLSVVGTIGAQCEIQWKDCDELDDCDSRLNVGPLQFMGPRIPLTSQQPLGWYARSEPPKIVHKTAVHSMRRILGLMVLGVLTSPSSPTQEKTYSAMGICLSMGEERLHCEAMFFDPKRLDSCTAQVTETTASLRAVTTTTNPDLIQIRERVAAPALDTAIGCSKEILPIIQAGAKVEKAKLSAFTKAFEEMNVAAIAAKRHVDKIIYGR